MPTSRVISKASTKEKSFFIRNLSLSVLVIIIAIWIVVSLLVYRIESQVPNGNINSVGNALWWGLVTLLTVGYGDYHPLSTSGRWLTSILMCSGVVTIGVITGQISSYLLKEALLTKRGFDQPEKLDGHFLLCGWKDDMQDLLEHILLFDSSLAVDDLVILANINADAYDALVASEKYRKLKVVIGEAFQIDHLMRAAPQRAKRIFILADRSRGEDGRASSAQEADARTIMTAINLHNVARGVAITAEVLDSRLGENMRMAGVSDVLYSRDYSRLLLGNAAGSTGIANVIYDLLNPATPCVMKTAIIPKEYVQGHYAEFKKFHESSNTGQQVVGILENTGNPHQMRERALREAQKTSNVQKMITNLHAAKELRFNHPVFSPSADYVIEERSVAIIIDSTNLGRSDAA